MKWFVKIPPRLCKHFFGFPCDFDVDFFLESTHAIYAWVKYLALYLLLLTGQLESFCLKVNLSVFKLATRHVDASGFIQSTVFLQKYFYFVLYVFRERKRFVLFLCFSCDRRIFFSSALQETAGEIENKPEQMEQTTTWTDGAFTDLCHPHWPLSPPPQVRIRRVIRAAKAFMRRIRNMWVTFSSEESHDVRWVSEWDNLFSASGASVWVNEWDPHLLRLRPPNLLQRQRPSSRRSSPSNQMLWSDGVLRPLRGRVRLLWSRFNRCWQRKTKLPFTHRRRGAGWGAV